MSFGTCGFESRFRYARPLVRWGMLPTREDLETISKMLGIVLGIPTLIIVSVIALVFGWSFGMFVLVTIASFLVLSLSLFILGFVQGAVSQWRTERKKA